MWKKTHRLAAYIYIIVGLLLFILGLLSVINSVITISLVVILVLFPFFIHGIYIKNYRYITFKKISIFNH
ncbi:SdpI family protein [Staphylococcus arlettae]|uniref:SdpI family protein n=1 Tax=Staphylococcus arlettae TaxID=29378 RepID=UPI0021755418|nr:SdpI family protein [Staphylococcus arlettae]